jgi:hypothetical protein
MSDQQVKYIDGYADAVTAGNALLCLPLEIRQDIFAFAALAYVRQHGSRSEAGNILQGRQCGWLPPMCHVNDTFFVESLPMFLRHTKMVIRGAYTAYCLRFFLQATHTFASIYELDFTQADAFTPLSAGARLLSDCINLRYVRLAFRGTDLKFPLDSSRAQSSADVVAGKLNRKAFAESYPFRQILSLKHVEMVTLHITFPGMSSVTVGYDHFWGIGGWLTRKFQRKGLKEVQVVSCSSRY